MFAAGPPLVEAALGLKVSPEELGGHEVHVVQSGVAHNLATGEAAAFSMARTFLSYFPSNSTQAPPRRPVEAQSRRRIDDMLDIIPLNSRRAYDVRDVLERVFDCGTVFELQPLHATSLVTALARLDGRAVMVVANQPRVSGGAITKEAAEKATHFLRVAGDFGLPTVFFADNPGVMAGPQAERAGTLRAAVGMYRAQRALRGPKLHVTLRKAFGFGSSLMGMNPFDRQTITLALPGISLGGLPAFGGARAAGSSAEEEMQMLASQDGAWQAADNGSYDRVIDPRDLRNELIDALSLST